MAIRHRRHRVALVPLDDRPCNLKSPRALARLIDYEALVPQRSWLGRFSTPGNCEEISAWLREVVGAVDCAVISLDMLAYGGLLASRTMRTPPEVARQRLQGLRNIKAEHPNVAIFASNVIMRSSISASADRSGADWERVGRYSELVDLVQRFGRSEDAGELDRLKQDVPRDILSEYLAARERNHEINSLSVELVADGTIDWLALTQEDASEHGLHRQEQERLHALIRERGVQDKVALYPGADEAGMTLLARFAQVHMLRVPTIAVVFSSAEHAGRIAPFEDRPVEQSVNQHIAAVGAEQVAAEDDADIRCFVNAPVDFTRKELRDSEELQQQRRAELEGFVGDIAAQLDAERATVICDVAFANGADPVLIDLLFERAQICRLTSYAAWNTAGNSIGSALAHGVMRLIALQDKGAFELAGRLRSFDTMRYLGLLDSLIDSESQHVELLVSRFVDDWAYQTDVRERATEYMADRMRRSAFDLANGDEEAEQFVRAHLSHAAQELYLNHFLGRRCVRIGAGQRSAYLMPCELEETHIALPWGRLFEVDLGFTFGMQLVGQEEE